MASSLVQRIARRIILELRDTPSGLTKDALADRLGVSGPSIQRALTHLRDECDSPLAYVRPGNFWRLRDPEFSLPLSDPEAGDLMAAMFAEALVAPLADEALSARLRRLVEQMDAEIRVRGTANVPAKTVVATATTVARTEPQVLARLLGSVRGGVVTIEYARVWTDASPSARLVIEPWQLRIHDGQLYVRAFSRYHGEARTFRVAQIDSVDSLDERASAPIPATDSIWGAEDPAFGIDHDRPGTATIRLRGAVARWVARTVWHPAQIDRFVAGADGQGDVLERKLAFSSTRELVRRLASVGDGIVSVEPAWLADALREHADALALALAPRTST